MAELEQPAELPMPDYIFPDKITDQLESGMSIFALKPAAISYRAVRSLAERLGFKGATREVILQEHPSKVSFSQGSLELTVHRNSGGWRFRNTARWQVDDGVSDVEFLDETAVELALKHIKELELADGQECRLLKVSRLHVGVTDRSTGYVEERVIDLGVAFQRTVGNLPVDGPGGKIVIYLDHTGNLTGVDRIWREVKNIYQRVERWRPLEAALDDVVKHWGRSGHGSIVVEEARVGYFELGWEHAQRYLQPAYIMPLKIVSPDRRFVMKSEHVLPAAANGIGTLMPRMSRVMQQVPRSARPEA
jgi:hypothetical protein